MLDKYVLYVNNVKTHYVVQKLESILFWKGDVDTYTFHGTSKVK